MNTTIKERIKIWFSKQKPKTQQWIWFVLLWIGGLLTVTILTYPIRFLIKSMQ